MSDYSIAKQDVDINNAARLLSSLLLFTCFFYKIKNGRDFVISNPIGRVSHHVLIAQSLEKCFHLKSNRLLIAVPPGYAKTTFLVYFIAWCLAHYPDCQFIYVSYSLERATEAVAEARDIVALREYRELFNVQISRDCRGREKWKTTCGGVVDAFGSAGGITGSNAGLLHPQDRFTGAALMDDMIKPSEAHGPVCPKVILNFKETIAQRPRNPYVPMINIGQVVNEGDLMNYLRQMGDGYKWDESIFPALDACDNALDPSKDSVEALKIKRAISPYVFYTQYQQECVSSGCALFPIDKFTLLHEEPKILYSFITCDTAETEKEYNDATVFSFFGLYKITVNGKDTGKWGLHWIDCVEMRVKPHMLEDEFMSFYTSCCSYKFIPSAIWIEVKSTGVTLYSVLKEVRGLNVREIKRDASSGSKADRFVSIEGTVGSSLVSLPAQGKHTQMCVKHMSKITANNTHRHDDIADTLYDGITVGLFNKAIINGLSDDKTDALSSALSQMIDRRNSAQRSAYNAIRRR